MGGNISRKASFMGAITDIIPSKEFLKASTRATRPPRSFHPCNIEFRASAESLMIFPKTLLTSVKSSFASSKSPTIISHLCVQPDCAASFRVSNNCVNVLTLVAASDAVWASCVISFACSSEYPCAIRSASV